MPSKALQEHDLVVLLADLPDEGLAAGDTGTIVHCYDDGDAYEIEFMEVTGKTKSVSTVERAQLLKLNWVPAMAR